MYVYMGHLKFEHTKPYENFFWKKNKIEYLSGEGVLAGDGIAENRRGMNDQEYHSGRWRIGKRWL
jgi:hypothetical protein